MNKKQLKVPNLLICTQPAPLPPFLLYAWPIKGINCFLFTSGEQPGSDLSGKLRSADSSAFISVQTQISFLNEASLLARPMKRRGTRPWRRKKKCLPQTNGARAEPWQQEGAEPLPVQEPGRAHDGKFLIKGGIADVPGLAARFYLC